jgi:hypothetical protein
VAEGTIERFYQDGGSLPENLPSYVVREADTKLEQLIKDGNFCYVLTARQMGKSSLRVRVSRTLEKQGFSCVSIDVSEIGVNNLQSADQWYLTLLSMVVKKLKLEKKEVLEWWAANSELTPVNRFYSFLTERVIELTSGRIVIFLDEIDSILSIDKTIFHSDDFFACIRSIYNARADNNALNRINFVVIGVASPNDLMHDAARTPFNIGASIHLDNFTFKEAAVLKEGLKKVTPESGELLKRIFYWTNGQPVLTQKLCFSIYKDDVHVVKSIAGLVKRHVDKLFLKNSLTDSDNSNLLNIQNRIENDDRYGLQILETYKTILTQDSVAEIKKDFSQIYLRLTGLVRCVNGLLEINNRIYEKKFNSDWAEHVSSKIHRPFNADLKDWVDSVKSDEKILRGERLAEYNKWCESRNDLTPSEKEFQNRSNFILAEEGAIAKIMKLLEDSREGVTKDRPDLPQQFAKYYEAYNIRGISKPQDIEERLDQTKKEEELELPEKLQQLRKEMKRKNSSKGSSFFASESESE